MKIEIRYPFVCEIKNNLMITQMLMMVRDKKNQDN